MITTDQKEDLEFKVKDPSTSALPMRIEVGEFQEEKKPFDYKIHHALYTIAQKVKPLSHPYIVGALGVGALPEIIQADISDTLYGKADGSHLRSGDYKDRYIFGCDAAEGERFTKGQTATQLIVGSAMILPALYFENPIMTTLSVYLATSAAARQAFCKESRAMGDPIITTIWCAARIVSNTIEAGIKKLKPDYEPSQLPASDVHIVNPGD